jgi:TRAP-type C4-dicarboxylate transport system substrate-binding protein
MERWDAIKMVVLSLLVSLFFIQHAHGAEKDLIIKIATLEPEGSSWMKTFNLLNSEVMKKTDNRVRFRIYPGGGLGDEMDILRKMKIGQIQGAALSAGGLSVLSKDIDVFQVPFLFQNYGEVDAVLKKMDSYFRKGLEESGYILLGWSEAGFVYLMSTLPISSVADLKKAKVWIWEESPMAESIFNEAGVKAVPLSIPDVLVGLQTGMVDVVYSPPTYAISFQWFTKIKYLTDVPLVYLAAGIVVRKDTFQSIPPSYQNFIMGSSQNYLDQLKIVTRKENQEAIKVMSKQGVKIITPSTGQIDEFKKLSNKAMRHISNQSYSQNVFDEVASILEDYRRREK